jgi:hypothetical protein
VVDVLDAIARWWPILVLIGFALWALAMKRASGSFADKAVVEQLRRDLDGVEKESRDDITKLKEEQIKLTERLQTLPSVEDFHAVSIKLTEVLGGQNTQRAEIEGMRQAVTTIDRSVNRIETYLLKKSEGK